MKFGSILFLILFSFATVGGQEPGGLDALNSEFGAEQTKLEGIRGQKVAKLFEGYSKAVERAAADFQKAGDLDNTLKARKEIERVKTDRTIGKADFTGADKMRPVLEAEMKKIEAAYQTELNQLNLLFAEKLEALKVELTKQGKIEEALAVSDKIKSMGAVSPAKSLPTAPPVAGNTPAAASEKISLRLVEDRVVDTVFSGNHHIHGTVKLEAGRHLLRKKVVIGDDKLEKTDPEFQGSVTIPPGCFIEKEEIYINQGDVTASGCLFSDMELSADLGGKFTLTDCLIEDVVFKKAGGWFMGYSAKFEIRNSVLRKSYFTKWNKANIGVNITNSTFLDVKFEEIEYKEDAGVERRDSWRNIENCRFINCEIPQSVLLITKNCVFEDCKFGRQERLPGKTLSEVTLYYDGYKPNPPEGTNNVEFKIEEATKLSGAVGSTLDYKIENDSLLPRN